MRRDWSATGPVALARVVTEVLSPVPLVSARARLKDHTVGQALAGAAVGALIAGVAMPLLAG